MLTPYPHYRSSEIEWLGDIPAHWRVGRLKFSATARTSNVDKHAKEDELPVQLCNYVDVYNNEFINGDLEFMQASATTQEIERFKIRKGDVLITKDSESWEDIAVPAMVTTELDDVLCGYHLAIVRSLPGEFHAGYLFRLFCSEMLNYQFKIRANGVTRFGLPAAAIDNALLLRPPIEEQEIISDYIDRETARIDALIDKKRRLLELLEEKRLAVITHAVTKGLNPNVPMKDSCIAWLGQVPAHWRVKQLRYVTRPGTLITYGIVQAGPDVEGGVPYIRTSDMAGDELPLEGYLRTSAEIDASYTRSKVSPGDLVIAIRATIGKPLIVPLELRGANLTQGTAKYSPSNEMSAEYVRYFLRSRGAIQEFKRLSKGATFKEITLEMLRKFPVLQPPPHEQVAISSSLASMSLELSKVNEKTRATIEQLQEYRSALVTAAVTGKIDVRSVAVQQEAAE